MRLDQDPPRLSELGDADPALREALRVVRSEAPSPEQLAQLADGALHGVVSGALPVASVAKLSALKLVALTVAVGALATAGWLWLGANVPGEHANREVTAHALDQTADILTATPSQHTVAVRSASNTQTPAPDSVELAELSEATRTKQAEQSEPVKRTHERTTDIGPQAAPLPRQSRPKSASRGATSSTTRTLPGEHEERRAPAQANTEPEATLIGAAQRTLASDAQQALRLLERHRQLYPNGEFAQERDMLQLDALARLKRPVPLHDQARAFLEKYPGSVHAPRVRKLLGQAQP